MERPILTVSYLNQYIKTMFDSDFSLKGLQIRGEISNFKRYPSGHIYFTLKDEESQIKAVMFYDYAKYLNNTIKDGDDVIVSGSVSVYPQRGEYQIYAQAIELYGKGKILEELELLKKKLAAEGLFDQSRKRPINKFPSKVGVISAANSAAMADIKTNLLRRYPLLEVVEIPSMVQGENAPKDLLRALNEAKKKEIDTLIIGRGGGASEDLSAFNDETLVREVAKFPVPVIAAVGHEIDFTLIDFVADARASTPTGAAELATMDKRELYQMLDDYSERLDASINNELEYYKNLILNIKNRPFFVNPKSMYENKINDLKNIDLRLTNAIKYVINIKKECISSLSSHLKALSPKGVLNRGYAIMQDESGKVINNTKDVDFNQLIKTILSDGIITSKVITKEKNNG